MATSPVELWYSVHQHGNDLCLSPGWPTKDEAIATGRMKAHKFLGVICSGWMSPSASAASAGPRIDKLLNDLRAIPDQIALIEDELRCAIVPFTTAACEEGKREGLEMAAKKLEQGNLTEWAGVIRSLAPEPTRETR